MDVAISQGVQCAGLVDLQRCGYRWIRVDGPMVRASARFAVGIELDAAHVVGELAALRVKEKADPANMVFGSIGVVDLLPQAYFYVEDLI